MSQRYTYRPVANGLRTDHPIPDLPFVDDAHIPVDNPDAIEAVGRDRGEGMWGRHDNMHADGWVAFTTDQFRHDLAWVVRGHPEHGRSVVLYRDTEASSVYMVYWSGPLLFRSGGYWWDGTTWHRPAQIWDRASETYVDRPVAGASIVSADDVLQAETTKPSRAEVLQIVDVDPDAPLSGRWSDHLALWAADRPDRRALAGSVVNVMASELTGDQLVGAAGMAEVAGVAASTFRSYLARGEGDIPLPQAVMGGRAMWSRPVAKDWAERRRRSDAGVADSMSSRRDDADSLSIGVSDLWDRFTQMFVSVLWERPDSRMRWALRWRNETAVRDVAKTLGWYAAIDLAHNLPLGDLSTTLRKAILDDFRDGKDLSAREQPFYGITRAVTRMLDWLIRHDPQIAATVVGEVIGEAERNLSLPREVVTNSLETALSLDGTLDFAEYRTFLDRAVGADKEA